MRDSPELASGSGAIEREAREPQCENQLSEPAGPWIPRDGNVIHIAEGDASRSQAVTDGVSREPRGVLYASKPLLLDGGHQVPVNHKRGGRVSVVSVYAENDYEGVTENCSASDVGL